MTALPSRPHVLEGAVEVIACANCPEPVTACLAPACTAYRHVHVRSRLHRCGNGVSFAFPVIQAVAR